MKVLYLAIATLTLAVSFSAAHHYHWKADFVFDDDAFKETLVALWNTSHEFSCMGKYLVGELIEHPHDCHKFLTCVADRIIELNCPDGKYFSAEQDMCAFDVNNLCPACAPKPTANCTENMCTNKNNMETYADPENCTKYYMCLGKEPIPQSCLLGQWYDPQQSTCVYDENAVCINPCPQEPGQIYLPNPNCEKYYLCSNGNVTVQNCTQGEFSAITGQCSLNAVCITAMCEAQPDWVTYAIPGISNMFYQCSNNKPTLQSCPPNSEYNALIDICVLVPSNNCNQTVCTSTYDGNAFGTINGDASSYCICRNNAAYEENCPTDYAFSTTMDICVSNSTCDPEFCINQPDLTVTAARYDPNSFCMCVSRVPVVVACPLNGTFYPETLKCGVTGFCDPNDCIGQPDNTIFPADVNTGFCKCVNNTGKFEPCEIGEVFDINIDICRPAALMKSYGCNVANCANSRMPIFGIMNDPFHFCYCNSPRNVVQRSCPSGTFFDATLLMCVSRKGAVAASTLSCDITACSKARNGRVYSIPAKASDKSFCYCLSPEKVISLDCPTGKRYSNRLGVCVETTQMNYLQEINGNSLALYGDSDQDCSGGHKHGDFVEHAEDCRRFHICAHGELHLMDCGEGNYYDAYTHVCDWDRYGLCVPATETGCMGLYHEGDMIGHNTNAQLYFICYNQQMIMQDCGPSNVFDSKRQLCVRQEQNSKKHLSRSPRSIVAAPSAIAADHSMEEKDSHCVENAKRSVPSNCSQYEQCIDGVWQRRWCKHQRYYNPELQKCLEPRDDYVCAYARVSGLPVCSNATLHQTEPHKHGKCNSYYRCQPDGKWAVLTCPKRQFYATLLNACIQTKRNTTICLSSNTTVALSNADSSIAATTLSEMITEKCQHTAVRHYEMDCGMYLMCLEGEWWHNYCGYGMYFNRTLNTCILRDGTEKCSSNNNMNAGSCITGERRAFPLNCSAYEVCDAQTQWQRENCPLGYAFDDMLLECVPQAEYALCSTNGLRRVCSDGQTRALLTSSPSPSSTSQLNNTKNDNHTDNTINNTIGNRTHFYYCEDERWQLGACLWNQSFSPALAACTPFEWWQNNNTTNATTALIPPVAMENVCAYFTHGSRLPHELYCNLYYACVHNVTFLAQCAAGEHFDKELKRCSAANVSLVCRMAQLTSANVTAKMQQICQNQSAPIQLPDTSDCTRFYKCAANNSQPKLSTCEAGTYFSAEQKMCIPSDGACPFVQNATILSTTNETIACADKHGVLLADSNNCNDFYVCLNGKSRHESCYEGHYFNATLRQCQLLPAMIEHDIGQTNTTATVNLNDNSTLVCAHKRRSHSEMCAELVSGAMLAVSSDCRRYISCQQQADGSAQIEQRCRNGESYDTLLGRCRQSDGTCLLENGQRIGECNSHHGQMVAQTRNCRGYFVCLHGQKIEMFCESHEYFDTKQLVCVKDELKQCKDDIPTQRIGVWPFLNCIGLTETQFYGNLLDDCRSFYQCVDGVPQLHFCPMDLYFDSVQQSCLPAKLAKCD